MHTHANSLTREALNGIEGSMERASTPGAARGTIYYGFYLARPYTAVGAVFF